MIAGIGHIAFRVADVQRSVDFYCGVLGMRELARLHRDDGSLWLVYIDAGSGTIIEIFPGGDPTVDVRQPARGYHHFSLAVDDLRQTLDDLRARGFTIEGEPTRGRDGNLGFWIVDPDGIRIELMEMSPDSLQARARAALSTEC